MKLLVLQLLLVSRVCFADLITVAPLGNTESSFPFGLELANVPSMRFQQVYGAGAFSLDQGQQAGFITEIRFYSDENNLGGFTSIISHARIKSSLGTSFGRAVQIESASSNAVKLSGCILLPHSTADSIYADSSETKVQLHSECVSTQTKGLSLT